MKSSLFKGTGGTVFQQKQTHAELMTKQFLSGRIEIAERKPPLQLSLRRYLHKEEYLPYKLSRPKGAK